MRPRWVPKSAVLAIHEWLLAEHGGAPGLRDDGVLEASLVSPQNRLAHADPDIFDLAASYAWSLTRDHPFLDGNKRVAFTVAGVFLEMNGHRLEASEQDAYHAVLALSTRGMDEAAFANWLRGNSRRLRRQRSRRVERTASRRKRPRTALGPKRRSK